MHAVPPLPPTTKTTTTMASSAPEPSSAKRPKRGDGSRDDGHGSAPAAAAAAQDSALAMRALVLPDEVVGSLGPVGLNALRLTAHVLRAKVADASVTSHAAADEPGWMWVDALRVRIRPVDAVQSVAELVAAVRVLAPRVLGFDGRIPVAAAQEGKEDVLAHAINVAGHALGTARCVRLLLATV